MKVAIIDNKTKRLKEVIELLAGHKISIFNGQQFKPSLVKDYDLVVLTGGSTGYSVINYPEYYENLLNFIKITKKPIIGICLGAQIIAYVAGGKLEKLNVKASGVEEVKINRNFYKKNMIKVYESHRFSIVSGSKNLEILARSKNGVEIFKYKDKPIYGMQFHPEVLTPKNEGREIFDLIFELLFKK